jgi:hypothetical protein
MSGVLPQGIEAVGAVVTSRGCKLDGKAVVAQQRTASMGRGI